VDSDQSAPPEIIGRGREAEVFAWGEGRVLKLYRTAEQREGASHEARITAAVHEAGCPAPCVYGTAEVGDRRGVILERLDGPMLMGRLLEGLKDANESLGLMAELQAALHGHEVAGLPMLHERIARRVERVRPVAGEYADAALERLALLPEGQTVCHWDLHPGNVIATERGPKIIDWSGAASGNPLADVARSLFLLLDAVVPGDVPEEIQRRVAEVRATGGPVYLDRYCELTGAKEENIRAWRLPVLVDRLADPIPEERDLILQLLRDA